MVDRANAARSRDRIVGGVFVLFVVTAQARWMGSAVVLLSAGLVIAYLVWIAAPWKNDPTAVLPMYLLAIAVQCVHFAEEYVTDFQRQFPKLIGGHEWSDAHFVAFNMAWLAMFVVAARCLPASAASLPRGPFPRAGGRGGQRCQPSDPVRDAAWVFHRSCHGSVLLVGRHRIAHQGLRQTSGAASNKMTDIKAGKSLDQVRAALLPQVEGWSWRAHASRRASFESLPSLRATNFECRRWPSGVHSTNSNWPTSNGRTQRHSVIFSAVSPWPQRPPRGSGRLEKGHSGISSGRHRQYSSAREAGVNPLRVLAA